MNPRLDARQARPMVDCLLSNHRLAALYDAFYSRRPDFGLYLPLVMSAQSVLDVGCGTGALLRAARKAGHGGRLCGSTPRMGCSSRRASDSTSSGSSVTSPR